MADLPLWAEYVGALGAGVGAFAAGAAAIYAARAARASQAAAEATTIAAEATADVARVERERWDAEREAMRHARITLRFEIDRDSNVPREFLVIENHGPAVASDVDMRGDAVLMGTIHFGADRLPLAALHPGGAHRLHLTVMYGQPVYFTPRVRWTDPAGTHEEVFPVTLV